MNNVLVDELPSSVILDGREYRINTDFRSCLRIMLAFEDNDLTPQEKRLILFENFYIDRPADISQATDRAMWFLNCGRDSIDDEGPRVFSWAKDSQLIYSAFHQTHKIDIQTASIHWWVFLSLFMDLGNNTAFCQLASLRRRVKTGQASKEDIKAAQELGELFQIDDIDTRSIDEKDQETEFMRLLSAGEKER
jgi:hypothetical protein